MHLEENEEDVKMAIELEKQFWEEEEKEREELWNRFSWKKSDLKEEEKQEI